MVRSNLGRGYIICKGFEVEVCLVFLRNNKEISVDINEGKNSRNEIREIMRSYVM